MDPQEALRLLEAARAAGDDEEIAEHIDNLAKWISSGGFEPDWSEARSARELVFRHPLLVHHVSPA